MKRKVPLLCISIILLVFITGCWSRRELNDLAIAVGIGIDKSGDQYKVSVQVVDPSEVAGKKLSGLAPVIMYQATGKTIFEALRKMTTISPRKIYLAHLRILVLGESLAREGIKDALDFMSRDPEIRNDFFIVVAKETNAEDTLKILTHLEKVPAVKLSSSLVTSQKSWAPTTTVKLDELISDLVSEGKHPVLTGLQVTGNQKIGQTKENIEAVRSPAELKFTELAVFKQDKLIGWLSEIEGKAYNYIHNHVSNTVSYVTCPHGGRLTLEILSSETKVKGRIRNEQPHIDIEVRIEANIGEVQCHLDLTKTETIAEVEKWTNQRIEEIIETTINKVKEDFKVDIFGFGDVIHRSNPQAWKELKEHWDRTFVSMPVHVKVSTTIRQFGKVSNSFMEEMKESNE
jgi:spore germination protein KC